MILSSIKFINKGFEIPALKNLEITYFYTDFFQFHEFLFEISVTYIKMKESKFTHQLSSYVSLHYVKAYMYISRRLDRVSGRRI